MNNDLPVRSNASLGPRRSGLIPAKRVFLAVITAALMLFVVPKGASGATDPADGFVPLSQEVRIGFPEVLYAQPGFGMEWWYVTGHLFSHERNLGFEVSFFRVGVTRFPTEGTFSVRDLYFAHFALTDQANKRFLFGERSSRGALAEAGSRSDRLDVWVGDWRLRGDVTQMNLSAEEPGYGLELVLEPIKPPAFQGDQGYSRKGENPHEASYYVSLPRLDASGTLRLEDQVLPVSGQAWMDREVMTPVHGAEVRGWDWFAVQLEDNREVMLYRLYTEKGVSNHSAGTVILADGNATALSSTEISYRASKQWRSPETGILYDVGWRVSVPRHDLQLEIVAVMNEQEFIARRSTRNAYWEGACEVRGTWQGQPILGRAYLEMNRERVSMFSGP